MKQCNTAAVAPQARPFPVVSYRPMLRAEARVAAARRGVPSGEAVAAVDIAYRETRGNRFAARRAGWHAVDAACAEVRA